ncbi:interferon-induced very large GTPase 1-like isoform X2 [Kryptolebias marmoratus]|uniref:interferon-induced very large GTPase 1-like isoform X2 n=1 Tax=Kryptolebias marmoratus TaxID=37003 RepID=UPI0007F93DE1|nr:interferon-induced very large GTPase 1-like isoform X2 [Kryptolebias marmoratus]
MEKPGEDHPPETSHGSTQGEPENRSAPSATKEKERSSEEGDSPMDTSGPIYLDLTLVLVGDLSSVETGAKNLLLDPDEQTNFSSKLYDLCGQRISVVNLLGQQSTEKLPLIQKINAFLLLISNGFHVSHYDSGVQWLEKTFGTQSLAHLMTVVTYNLGENCEGILEDLKAFASFDEKRFHTCTKSMTEAGEIADLLRKINNMVSVNSPRCYTGLMQENKTETSDEKLCENKETPGKISDEIIQKQQHQEETEALFARLHLQDRYQQKLSKVDFLQISQPITPCHDTSEKDLAYYFLHKLIMLDYRARYIPVKQDSIEVTEPKPISVSDTSEADEDDLEDFLNTNVTTHQLKQTHIHPMDVQMAVFHCSDSFLRQIMITKLSQCQYALPLLVPDPFTMETECPLWTFRQITKTWKVTKGDSNITMKSVPIYKAERPLVSFFRLGSLSVSKSELMNSLINDRHSTFFHRNCAGSTKSRLLLDGVAEIAWYCPAGKPNDAFNDCIAFCNLHGDAVMTEKQRDILIEKSSVNVVLVPKLQKDDKSWPVISALFKLKKPLICLIVDDTCDAVETKKGKYKLGLKEKSQSDVSGVLKRIIQEVLSSEDTSILKTSFQLETMAEVSGIKVDESNPMCQKGKISAMKIDDLLQGKDVSRIKEEFLACQGQLWHKWCEKNKELYHLKGQSIEQEKSMKERQLMEIRQEQCAASCSELMKLFTKSLSSLESKDKEYFLKWTQILTDALSTDDISSILQSYDNTWSEVLALKNKHDKSEVLEAKKAELEGLSKKLQSATFGLEHIFREMGQMYEAQKSCHPNRRWGEWTKYPKLAADLLISGHPLELLDGDAGHVPLKWIPSLLEEVIKKLGDQKVFVLSVLGVQSSGKSTMLNAMFGLQFAVSAGRCTKGAFMQLVKISAEFKKNFKFDYVLVVDTEGLRALELGGNISLHHDNELATFVVGVGNMTLINIFGENPADMQDVLQIVVQAFMRMKRVKITPSCIFVHQNVTDVAAAEKNMDGKRRLQEKLDQMTQLAAKEEDCSAECFSDVIAFNVQTDVKYLAQLWEGSPPMAPPNPGYSESIQDLKNVILSKASKSDGVRLSKLNANIQDLWKALLNENFVFSFKNTLEIAVYRKLEVQYGNWTWAIRNNMLEIENQLYNRIENGDLNKVEKSYLVNETSKMYEEIKTAMIKYFENDKEKEMLVQWRGRFESKIKEFRDEQVKVVKRKLDGVIEQKNARKKMDDKKAVFETKLMQKSKELAQQLKDKAKDDEELQKQFSFVWKTWVTELTSDTKPVEDINLEEDLSTILKELGVEENHLHEFKTSGRYKNISKMGNYKDYVIFRKKQRLCEASGQPDNDERKSKDASKQGNVVTTFLANLFSTSSSKNQNSDSDLSSQDQEQIRNLINNAKEMSLNAIKEKPVSTRGYQSTYLQEMIQLVIENVVKSESAWRYSLKREFTIDLILYVFDFAKTWFQESQEKFRKNNDPLIYLESKKSQYYNIFKIFCQGSSSAVVLAELMCEKLNTSIAEAVYTKTAMSLAREMKCNFPVFSGNRVDLEKHMLKSLADKENFNSFIEYIYYPRRQSEAFIKAEVQKYIYTDQVDKVDDIFKKHHEDINTLVSQAFFTASKKVQPPLGNTNTWLNEVCSLLKDELRLDGFCFQNFDDIKDFDFLVKEANKKLESVKKQTDSFSRDGMKNARQTPEEILIEHLCKCCWVKCPFCFAVCTNTVENHSPDDHCVPFHRSAAVNGTHYWNTDIFSIQFCTSEVASDHSFYPDSDSDKTFPYKWYRTAGPQFASWKITPDESKLPYWKWFVWRFKDDLVKHYKCKFEKDGKIPEDWDKISKEEAIKSLEEM